MCTHGARMPVMLLPGLDELSAVDALVNMRTRLQPTSADLTSGRVDAKAEVLQLKIFPGGSMETSFTSGMRLQAQNKHLRSNHATVVSPCAPMAAVV